MKSCQFALLWILLLTLTQCTPVDTRFTYFPNGAINTKSEFVNGKREGAYFEYYPNGNLKLNLNWSHGLTEGEFTEYFENGVISAKGEYRAGKLISATEYFGSGKISLIKYYDRNGEMINIKKFFEDGSIDYKAFPFLYTVPFGDTLKFGTVSMLKSRIVNVYDSLYLNGILIITTKLDTTNVSKVVRVTDTVKIIKPVHKLEFVYRFKPGKLGNDTIRGQFLFKKETEEDITYHSELFAYPIYVEP